MPHGPKLDDAPSEVAVADPAVGRAVAQALLEIGAVNMRPDQPYTLTSGWASPVYIDCRRVISYPVQRRRIMAHAVDRVRRQIGVDTIDAIAGGETAGIPYAAWLSELLDRPMLYVRKKPKGVGRRAQIEGDLAEGARVLLVEDLASDGTSKVTFARALREAGAVCDHALVVFFYRAFPGVVDALAEQRLSLHALADWSDILAVAEETAAFDSGVLRQVRVFLEDPVGWSARHGGRAS